uniref:PHD-type domain-containing protein n=1 Tax=Arundo donax TaxID=35708 RepID=A0A0A9E8L6_ARUDO
MEIAKNGIASGSIRDLPPSKRFKYVNSQPGSTPCLPLPAKKRAFPPPPPPESETEAVAVPICLPAKKRAIVAPPPDDAVPPCLPAKKRAYTPPADAVIPVACLPAKKRVYAPPAADMAASPCLPAKKRVDAAPPADMAASPCVPVKKRACAPPPPDMVAATCVPAKKRVHAPPHQGDSVCSRPVCLPSNKRVMPPPSPSVESDGDGVRVAAVKDARPQGSNKHGGAISPRAANGAEGFVRDKEFKKPEKPIIPKEISEQISGKPSPRSPNKSRDPDKKACKVVNGVEVRKKVENEKAARKEEPRNGADEEARVPEHEVVEEEDDGVLCAVCGSTDGDPSDPIVFCDGCDLMVHASCYGNPLALAIPDGDWFCSLCSAKKSKPAAARPSCCLCPASGGAMKRTTDGRWAHISCALLVPEVFFRDPDGRDGVDCSRVPTHRFTKECYICESSSGCALECSQPKCNLGFHVSCGLDGGLCIEYREGKGGAIVAGFCREHTELWEKQQLTGKYKIVARGQE